eukprot:3844791-Rhodomonas_salina.1
MCGCSTACVCWCLRPHIATGRLPCAVNAVLAPPVALCRPSRAQRACVTAGRRAHSVATSTCSTALVGSEGGSADASGSEQGLALMRKWEDSQLEGKERQSRWLHAGTSLCFPYAMPGTSICFPYAMPGEVRENLGALWSCLHTFCLTSFTEEKRRQRLRPPPAPGRLRMRQNGVARVADCDAGGRRRDRGG